MKGKLKHRITQRSKKQTAGLGGGGEKVETGGAGGGERGVRKGSKWGEEPEPKGGEDRR